MISTTRRSAGTGRGIVVNGRVERASERRRARDTDAHLLEERAERDCRVGDRRRLLGRDEQVLEPGVDDRVDELFLGRVVPVERADADLGTRRDVGHLRVDAALGEHLGCRDEDALAVAARVGRGAVPLRCSTDGLEVLRDADRRFTDAARRTHRA